MFLNNSFKFCVHNLKLQVPVKKFYHIKLKPYSDSTFVHNIENVDDKVKKCASKLVYNSVLERKRIEKYLGRKNLPKQLTPEERAREREFARMGPIPVSIQYLVDDFVDKKDENPEELEKDDDHGITQFPYSASFELPETDMKNSKDDRRKSEDVAAEVEEEVRRRHELQEEMRNWMTAYDNFDESLSVENEAEKEWEVNYGTPDPKTVISNVPCGGCGALLHCKDTAIPGYIPSEIFKNSSEKGGANLEAIICQRCHFLKNYDLALQVQVKPEDYPQILATVREKAGLILLMVDLMDFQCSIWPGIGEIFGPKIPIVVVGNKIDLLPKDSKDYLKRVKRILEDTVKIAGFATFNIKDVSLISAKTGYGVEELISTLLNLWVRGDVYIVGCTNVGKSSLFNALIKSDYCKTQAINLIQRATTSVWPGTTLNLLKFPIKRPNGFRQFVRGKRLELYNAQMKEENRLRLEELRKTKKTEYATLIGHIGISREPEEKEVDDSKDNFSIQGHGNASGKIKMGIDEKNKDYVHSKWCFDTPGVVQPDQIIHFLTAEELMLTLPKDLISPRSFCVPLGSSIFIGGLSRLDYINGTGSVRLTVFASKELPITITQIEDADEVYKELLGSRLLKVPAQSEDRLSKWPGLELARSFKIMGEGSQKSVSDVLLSSSGWIAITGKFGLEYEFQAWTPEKRGVYLRESLLPFAIALAGDRIKKTVAFKTHKFFLQ